MENFPFYLLIIPIIPFLVISSIIWLVYSESVKPLSEKYHTFWPRFWSPTVDGLILFPIALLISFIQLKIELVFFIGIIFYFFQNTYNYFYLILMHGKYGQTVGKMVCKVKVVDYKSENPISFKQAWMRDIIPIIILLMWLPFYQMESNDTDATNSTALAIGSYFVGSLFLIWFLAEIVTMLTNEKRRALHDFIAGTVVIRTNINDHGDSSAV